MRAAPEYAFWFRLAGHLKCTVRELQLRMTAREFVEWGVYYQLDPWGGERGDLQAAIVASTVANCNRTKGRAYKLTDFMLKFGRRAKEMTVDSMHAIFKVWAKAVNKKAGGPEIK